MKSIEEKINENFEAYDSYIDVALKLYRNTLFSAEDLISFPNSEGKTFEIGENILKDHDKKWSEMLDDFENLVNLNREISGRQTNKLMRLNFLNEKGNLPEILDVFCQEQIQVAENLAQLYKKLVEYVGKLSNLNSEYVTQDILKIFGKQAEKCGQYIDCYMKNHHKQIKEDYKENKKNVILKR